MSEKQLTILLSARHDEGLAERIRQIAPAARIVSRQDLDRKPAVIADVEVAYGGIKPELFARAVRLRWLQTTGAGVAWAQRRKSATTPWSSRTHTSTPTRSPSISSACC